MSDKVTAVSLDSDGTLSLGGTGAENREHGSSAAGAVELPSIQGEGGRHPGG